MHLLRQYIDIYCPIAYHYNQTEWNRKSEAKGKEIWFYNCVRALFSPWPNSMAYNRLLMKCGPRFSPNFPSITCKGFLYLWSSDAYYHGSYNFAYNGWGNGWFIYADTDGQIHDSIRWDNYRDAAQDYEYLWLMKNATIAATGSGPPKFSDITRCSKFSLPKILFIIVIPAPVY